MSKTWGDEINKERMIFGTTILTDDHSISSYDIHDDDVIQLGVAPGHIPSARVCRSVARAAGVWPIPGDFFTDNIILQAPMHEAKQRLLTMTMLD